MLDDQRIVSLLGVFVTLLTIIPTYVGWIAPTQAPKPHLVSIPVFATNISQQLRDVPPGTLKFNLQFGSEELKNLSSVVGVLLNDGSAPVYQRDYDGNLSVNVNQPWKIVGVFNSPAAKLQPKWQRVSDTRYEAPPQLFNPGDQIAATVYMTNPTLDSSVFSAEFTSGFKWDVHVANLATIADQTSVTNDTHAITWLPIVIVLSGWKLVFTILLASLFFATYLFLYNRLWIERTWKFTEILLVTTSGLLSFAAAESLSTAIVPIKIPRISFDETPFNLSINLPWIGLNAVMLGFLFFKNLRNPNIAAKTP